MKKHILIFFNLLFLTKKYNLIEYLDLVENTNASDSFVDDSDIIRAIDSIIEQIKKD